MSNKILTPKHLDFGIVQSDCRSVKIWNQVYPIYYKSLIDRKVEFGTAIKGKLQELPNIAIGNIIEIPVLGKVKVSKIKENTVFFENVEGTFDISRLNISSLSATVFVCTENK